MRAIIQKGQLYVKMYGWLPFWPFTDLTRNALLLATPYSNLDATSIGGQFKSLLRVEKWLCRSYIETWTISKRKNLNIFQVPGALRPATEEDLQTLLRMLRSTGSQHLDTWVNDVRLRNIMDPTELLRIKNLAMRL